MLALDMIVGDSLVTEGIFFLMSLGIALIGWYVRKMDTRLDLAERNKVDKESFLEFKNDMKKEFEALHKDITHHDRGSGNLSIQMAVLNEKMTRVELMLQRCPKCFTQNFMSNEE